MKSKEIIISVILITVGLISCVKNKPTENQASIISTDAELKKLDEGYKFTEGPAVNKNGDVFFTDQPNNKIVKWTASTGKFSTFLEPSGRANGTYFDMNGNLIACADMENQLWSIDPDGNVTVLVEYYDEKLLNGPNDVWVNPIDGSIYFTDPLYKRGYWARDPEQQQDGRHLYYLSADYTELRRVDENLKQPNGIVGTPDGKHLYVADPGDKKTYVYDIQEDGSLANRQLFVERGSDGMTIDNEGNLYLTGDGVTVFSKEGEEIRSIPIEEGTTNVVFGGPDRDLLFITAKTAVYGLKMDVKGVN